ncbi:acetyl-CoA carboxylase biotin carboxylase subunit family protein [Streptomyces sp. NPDC093094]|uniref:ATP-grasp domain-containing protein n=1 Tax=Streptomyces sp. NPDC093094 TaxID=3366026 RepID=UPI0038024193
MSDRPVIVVVYDRGSASLLDIVDGLTPIGTPVLALWPSEHGADVQPLAQEMLTVEVLDPEDLDGSAERLRAHAPAAILTYSETKLAVTAQLARRLGLAYHTPATVELLRDKYAQRQRLRERGVDSVRSHRLREAGDWPAALAAVGLPAVLKPASGQGSRSTHAVTDADAGARLAAELLTGPDRESTLVLEEYLHGRDCAPYGDYVSVESAVSGQRISHWAVTGKFPLAPPFRETGNIRPAVLPDDERAALLELVTGALRALDITTGVTHTEVKLTPDGPRIIEVNGRLGGWQVQLARLAGDLDPVALAARLALGEDVAHVRADDERVVFTRAVAAPVEGGTYLSVQGLRTALALDGVEHVVTRYAPGETVPAGVHSAEIAWVEGAVADHATALRVSAQALRELAFTVEAPDGTPYTVRESVPEPEPSAVP